MHALERIARLEDVIKNLEDLFDLFPEFCALWEHVNRDFSDYRSAEFYAKTAMSIAILKNQVEYELKIISEGDNSSIFMQ